MISTRTRRLGVVTLGATIILGGAAAATLTAYPVAAAGVVSLVTTVSCSVTGSNWCISGNNTSSGIGVIGTSKTGTGLRGTSTSQYGLKATSVSNIAILAQTTTGSTAISATAGNGYGVSGTSTTGTAGVFGTSASSIGAGVYGDATSTSSASKGVSGYSFDGYGVYGSSPGPAGFGVEGVGGLIGVIGSSDTGIGVEAISNSGTGADISGQDYGVIVRSASMPISEAYPIVAADSDGNNLFYVDNVGDVGYSGALKKFTQLKGGALVKSFASNTTAPTVEDTGTAQLVGGTASVRLDPVFAASIDAASSYRVFLTPNGETHVLYVPLKTPTGFVVREAQAGRSTVSFDYRIVATAAGKAGQRMAIVNAASEPHAPPMRALRSALGGKTNVEPPNHGP